MSATLKYFLNFLNISFVYPEYTEQCKTMF